MLTPSFHSPHSVVILDVGHYTGFITNTANYCLFFRATRRGVHMLHANDRRHHNDNQTARRSLRMSFISCRVFATSWKEIWDAVNPQ